MPAPKLRRVFVTPKKGELVFYPREMRFLDAHGEMVPVAGYWDRLAKRGLVTIDKPELVKPNMKWSRQELMAYAFTNGLRLQGSLPKEAILEKLWEAGLCS